MSLSGVDVSRWQGTSPAFANFNFMFARATYGTTTDTKFDDHIAAADKAGIVTGAYHFGYGSKVASPEAQADAFMKVALREMADIWALDYEPSKSPMTQAEVRRFIARVHAAGYRIGLYASRSGFPFNLGQDFDWIADWDASVFPAHSEFWQYRGTPLDLDKFNGTVDQLLALAAAPGSTAAGNIHPEGEDMKFINSNGYSVDSGLRLNVGDGHAWLYLDGTPGGTIADGAALVVVGRGDATNGEYICQIGTAVPYGDKPRPTLVLIRSTNDPFPAPKTPVAPPPADTTPFSQSDIDKAVAADRLKAHVSYD